MYKRVIQNLCTFILLCFFSSTAMAANLTNSPAEKHSKNPFVGTVTVNSSTNETCTGNNDGSVNFTIDNLGNAISVIVLIGNPATGSSQNATWTVTSGSGSGGFSNLEPGTFNIQFLANNSITGTSPPPEFTIEAGGAIISLASTEPSCNGDSDGSVTVTASGGVAPYEYSIGTARYQTVNTFGSLAIGQYTFNVRDASGCVTSETFTLTEPDIITTTVTSTAPTCNGGTNGWVAVQASGGNGGYLYSIDAGATFVSTGSFTGLTAGSYTILTKDSNDCSITENVTVTEPTVVTGALVSSTDVTCINQNDGTVTLSASGGTGSYQVWFANTNGGGFLRSFTSNVPIIGIEDASYDLQISDTNGCNFSSTISVTITEPDELEAGTTINAGSTTIVGVDLVTTICAGTAADITLSATGGTAPYEYSLDGTNFVTNPLFSNLGPGTYLNVVRDANGCTDQTVRDRIIQENTPITFTVNTEDATCFGLSDGRVLTSNIQGGGGSYTYSIDGVNFQSNMDFVDLAAGTYTVTIKDQGGCTGTSSATISEPIESIASVNVISNVSCFGGNDGSIDATITNTTGTFSYVLNNGTPQSSNTFTALAAGNYTLDITHGTNNCVSSATFTITEPASFTAAATTTDLTCNGGATGAISVTVSGGTAPYQYTIDGTNFGSANTFSQLTAGTYVIGVLDATNCPASVIVSITEPTPIAVTYLASPPTCTGDTDGMIQVNLASGGTGVLKIRLQGTTTLGFSIPNLSPGEYMVEMVDDNGCTVTNAVTVPEAFIVTADVTVDSNASGCGNSDGAFTLSNPRKGNSNLPSVEYSIDGQNFQASSSFTGLTAGSYSVTIKDVSVNSGTGNCEGTVSLTITEPSGITGTITSTDVDCNGAMTGTADVSGVTGGTSPYTYSIDGVNFASSSSFSSLAAGTYNVTIRDNGGCTTVLTTSIIEPNALIATFTTSDISCNGQNDGSISLSITGGTAPYTWTDMLTSNTPQSVTGSTATFTTSSGTRANMATITDAKGCTYSVDFTINEPDALIGSITNVTDATCAGANDGTITITATGGTEPYEATVDGIQYFPLATNGVIAGIGSVTIANITLRDANGCEITIAGFTVSEPGPITADITTTDTSCNGDGDGSIAITPTSSTNTTFEYSLDGTNFVTGNTFNQLTAGTYTVTVRETGVNCTNTLTTEIAEPDVLETMASSIDVTCNGQEDGQIIVAAVGGTAPFEYSIDGGTTFQVEDFTGLDLGSYTLMVRDANGCTANKTITVIEPTQLVASVTVSGNVSCNGLSDGLAAETVTGGTTPYTYSLDGTNFTGTVDLTALTAGAYTLTVKDANGCEELAGFTITEPTAIVPVVSTSSDISCNGLADGSFTVTATGGDGTYGYSLDGTNFSTTNTFTSLAAGTYTVTIQDGNNCTETIMQTIIEPTALALQFEAADISCNGAGDGQIAGFATGGTGPYTYSIDGTTFQSTAFTELAAGAYTLTVKDANDCSTTATVNVAEPAILASTLTSTTNVDCKGNATGSAIIDVTGGSTPYFYSMDGTVFNTSADLTVLAAGAYTVTVRDANSCESTVSFTITEPDALGVSVSMASDVSCSAGTDGSISLSGAGGTAPYQYSMDGTTFGSESSFTNLAAGNYTLTIQDANGCIATINTVITEPAALVVTTQTQDINCHGDSDGAITPTTTGGTAPYEYSLDGTNFQSGAFTGLNAGNYTVTLRDANGCSTSASVTLTEPALLTGTTVITSISCFGESTGAITVTATGGTGSYQYAIDGTNFQASSTFDGLTANSYTITLQDANGCTSTVAAEVTQPAELTATASVVNDNTINVTATGGTAPYEYQLDNGSFQSSNSFTGLANGDYAIAVRDANDCTVSTTGSLIITSVDNPNVPVTLRAYPNPADKYLTFSQLKAGDEIILISLKGNSLDRTLIKEDQDSYQKDISGIRQKMFLVIVTNQSGRVKLRQKVMKVE